MVTMANTYYACSDINTNVCSISYQHFLIHFWTEKLLIHLLIYDFPAKSWSLWSILKLLHTSAKILTVCPCFSVVFTWHSYSGYGLRLAQRVHLHMLKGFVGSGLEVPGCNEKSVRAWTQTHHTHIPPFTVGGEIIKVKWCEQSSPNFDQQAAISAASLNKQPLWSNLDKR